jgi:hypothetical protein
MSTSIAERFTLHLFVLIGWCDIILVDLVLAAFDFIAARWNVTCDLGDSATG